MKNNFDLCLAKVLQDEGGYTNDPNDSGGPTNFGITVSDYRKYIRKNGTAEDVRNMSMDQAKVIYKARYWNALGCDNLPNGVDYTCFDYGVNSGLGRPINCLKQFKGKSETDLINAINDERTSFLRRIGVGKNAKFLKGWLSRVNRVRLTSLHMAEQPSKSSSATTGIIVAGASAGASIWHWGLQHWIEISASAAVIAVIFGVLIHYLRKN